jgi:hypothetical protein
MKNGLLSLVELAFGMQRLSSFDEFFLGSKSSSSSSSSSFFFFFFFFFSSLCGALIFA